MQLQIQSGGLGVGIVSAQEPPAIRVDVNLVRILATVRTPGGELVRSLSRDDFEIFDNGARQEIAVFETQSAQPLSVALLVDASGSTAKDLKLEAESASRFLKALLTEGNSSDRVALFSFNWQVEQHTDFTGSYRRLTSIAAAG